MPGGAKEDPRLSRMVRRYERFRDSAAPVYASGAGGAYLGNKFGRGLADPFADRYARHLHGNLDAKRVREASPWASNEVADVYGDATRWRKQGARKAVKSRVGLAGAALGAGIGGGLALNTQLRRKYRERRA